MTKKISRVLGTFLVLVNFGYFIPLTIEIIATDGGPFGCGILLLQVTIPTNLLILPGTLTWTSRSDSQTGFLVANSLGTIWTLFWSIFFMATPK